MPYLNLKLSGAPDEATVAALASRLTELTATLLRKKREVTALSVEWVPPAHWFIGGAALAGKSPASFFLDIKITAGTNSPEEKAEFIRAAFAAVQGHLGNLHPASYVTIHEVRGDAWGYQGITQAARLAAAEPPSPILYGDHS